MKLHIFEHLESGNEELFLMIGKYALDRSVAEELGNNIYSQVGQIWIIAKKDDEIEGFISLLNQKNKTCKAFNLYVSNKSAKRQLIKKAVKLASERDCKTIAIVDEDTQEEFYKSIGFTSITQRGRFYRYIKDLS